jgi:DNA-binding IclR family transcriptional regulator
MTEGQVKEKQGVQSLEIGIAMLEAVIAAQRPLRLMEVAQMVSMSPSKARMYLISLIRTGMVEQDSASGVYRPGAAAARLGFMAMHADGLLTVAQELASNLGATTGDPVILSRWDGDHSLIVFTSERSNSLPIEFRVGRSTNLLNTATGKTFLAYMTPSQRSAALSAQGVAEIDTAMAKELESIRAAGYALSEAIYLEHGVTLNGFGAIATPIFNASLDLRFVLTVIYRSAAERSTTKDLIETLLKKSAEISQSHVS